MAKQIIYRKLAEIKKLPNNPRTIKKDDMERLKQSIKNNPDYFEARPIILSDRTGELVIIAGNQRYEAAKALKMPEVPTYLLSGLDEEREREIIIRDNISNGEWDMDALANEWDAGQLEEWGVIPKWLEPEEPESKEESEDEIIERKRREFKEQMERGELDEDDPEYQEFLKKFEAKKTTDDCYTPELIYGAVADWVAQEYGVSRANFVRPFYPGGDYQHEQYKPTDIVVDNPPFSILAEIQRFYVAKGIRFFLFAPSLTLFGAQQEGTTVLPVGVSCIYENRANVNTSFITNPEDPTIRFRSVPELYQAVKAANDENLHRLRKQVPKYSYPSHIVTAAFVSSLSKHGIPFEVKCSESERISQLDSQRESNKAIFGSGYIICDRKAAEKAAAEKAAAEKAAAEKAAAEKAAATKWELSPREQEIIKRLNQEAGDD